MKKPLETVLYSTLGVAAVFLLLVAVNFLNSQAPKRVDLTAEKAYTLSPGTKAILSKLDTPVQIRFYCSRNENMPPQLNLYAQQIEDLLGEYKQASKGRIEIQKLDPEPDSDAEDSAKLDGVEGQLLQNGEKLYLGLSVSMLDKKEALPFITPDRERLLEYDISRAITRVVTTQKATVGIMSPLHPLGSQIPVQLLRQMGQQGEEPWVLCSELKRDFTVQDVPMTSDKIPDNIKVLVVVHPRGITDVAQYAIDQFILRGGKLIAFLDPSAVLERPDPQQRQNRTEGGSNLEKLLGAWGISFDSTKTVADMNYLWSSRQGKVPGVLALTSEALAKDDIVTAGADNIFMIFPGAFSGTPVNGLKESVLIKSSTNAQLVEPMVAQNAAQEVINNFAPANKELPLAIRLTGKFKTAFPDGKPKDTTADKDKADKKDDKAAEPQIKESARENTVVLIGDSDMLQDQATVTEIQNPFGGAPMRMPSNGNLAFAQGAIEQLTGDSNLIAVRSRASRERPFTVVKKMQADAEAAYRKEIKDLETSLSDTQRKLQELQEHRQGDSKSGQRFILSPEQQSELENFRKTEADTKKRLKEMRRTLRADTDALENRVKWINIAGMPALVIVSGIGFSILKRKRSAAK